MPDAFTTAGYAGGAAARRRGDRGRQPADSRATPRAHPRRARRAAAATPPPAIALRDLSAPEADPLRLRRSVPTKAGQRGSCCSTSARPRVHPHRPPRRPHLARRRSALQLPAAGIPAPPTIVVCATPVLGTDLVEHVIQPLIALLPGRRSVRRLRVVVGGHAPTTRTSSPASPPRPRRGAVRRRPLRVHVTRHPRRGRRRPRTCAAHGPGRQEPGGQERRDRHVQRADHAARARAGRARRRVRRPRAADQQTLTRAAARRHRARLGRHRRRAARPGRARRRRSSPPRSPPPVADAPTAWPRPTGPTRSNRSTTTRPAYRPRRRARRRRGRAGTPTNRSRWPKALQEADLHRIGRMFVGLPQLGFVTFTTSARSAALGYRPPGAALPRRRRRRPGAPTCWPRRSSSTDRRATDLRLDHRAGAAGGRARTSTSLDDADRAADPGRRSTTSAVATDDIAAAPDHDDFCGALERWGRALVHLAELLLAPLAGAGVAGAELFEPLAVKLLRHSYPRLAAVLTVAGVIVDDPTSGARINWTALRDFLTDPPGPRRRGVLGRACCRAGRRRHRSGARAARRAPAARARHDRCPAPRRAADRPARAAAGEPDAPRRSGATSASAARAGSRSRSRCGTAPTADLLLAELTSLARRRGARAGHQPADPLPAPARRRAHGHRLRDVAAAERRTRRSTSCAPTRGARRAPRTGRAGRPRLRRRRHGTWNAAVRPRPAAQASNEASLAIGRETTGDEPDLLLGPPYDTRLVVHDLGADCTCARAASPASRSVGTSRASAIVLTNRWLRSLGEANTSLREGLRFDLDLDAGVRRGHRLQPGRRGRADLPLAPRQGRSASRCSRCGSTRSSSSCPIHATEDQLRRPRSRADAHFSATLGPVTMVLDGAGGWVGWWADDPGGDKHCVGLLPPTGAGLQLDVPGRDRRRLPRLHRRSHRSLRRRRHRGRRAAEGHLGLLRHRLRAPRADRSADRHRPAYVDHRRARRHVPARPAARLGAQPAGRGRHRRHQPPRRHRRAARAAHLRRGRATCSLPTTRSATRPSLLGDLAAIFPARGRRLRRRASPASSAGSRCIDDSFVKLAIGVIVELARPDEDRDPGLGPGAGAALRVGAVAADRRGGRGRPRAQDVRDRRHDPAREAARDLHDHGRRRVAGQLGRPALPHGHARRLPPRLPPRAGRVPEARAAAVRRSTSHCCPKR